MNLLTVLYLGSQVLFYKKHSAAEKNGLKTTALGKHSTHLLLCLKLLDHYTFFFLPQSYRGFKMPCFAKVISTSKKSLSNPTISENQLFVLFQTCFCEFIFT